MPENTKEIGASAQLQTMLASLEKQDALWEEINQGHDANERMSAEAMNMLEKLNALGWQAEWQKDRRKNLQFAYNRAMRGYEMAGAINPPAGIDRVQKLLFQDTGHLSDEDVREINDFIQILENTKF